MSEAGSVQVVVSEAPDLIVEVSETPDSPPVQITQPQEPTVVEVLIPGPRGPEGPQGPPGSGGDLYYIHDQGSPAETWEVQHNLGKPPAFVVIATDGAQEDPSPEYVDENLLRLHFGDPVSGRAYLN